MSLHPFSQPRTDLTRCCDLSLFSSEIGLFSWEQEKNILQEKQQQATCSLGPVSPSFCVKEEGTEQKRKRLVTLPKKQIWLPRACSAP